MFNIFLIKNSFTLSDYISLFLILCISSDIIHTSLSPFLLNFPYFSALKNLYCSSAFMMSCHKIRERNFYTKSYRYTIGGRREEN